MDFRLEACELTVGVHQPERASARAVIVNAFVFVCALLASSRHGVHAQAVCGAGVIRHCAALGGLLHVAALAGLRVNLPIMALNSTRPPSVVMRCNTFIHFVGFSRIA